MFYIECRTLKNNTWGNWFPIWDSEDGTDCANYLKVLVELENSMNGPAHVREHRIVYVVKED